MTRNTVLPPEFSLAEVVQPSAGVSQRILVADDEPDIRKLYSEVLVRVGYQVDSAEDGAVAWHALNAQRYDLLLTDNGMPKVGGVELLRRVHAAGLAVPVIMATASEPAEIFAQSPWLRPAKTLLKPFTLIELLRAVKQVLRGATSPSRSQSKLRTKSPVPPVARD